MFFKRVSPKGSIGVQGGFSSSFASNKEVVLKHMLAKGFLLGTWLYMYVQRKIVHGDGDEISSGVCEAVCDMTSRRFFTLQII